MSRDVWCVYRCPRIKRGEIPHSEVLMTSGYATAEEAMNAANAMKRDDPAHSYTVGLS
jgi:hypothetical protein